jgi:hypothetical protein
MCSVGGAAFRDGVETGNLGREKRQLYLVKVRIMHIFLFISPCYQVLSITV